MKILRMFFVIACAILFSGTAYADGSGPEASSALMAALKGQQAEILSGEQGVYIIFVQSLDGMSTVKNVEALGTLYLLAAQGLYQTLVFEADKTNKELYLLGYRLVDDIWGEVAIYNPADLPDIDFQKAYRLVKENAGKDKAIASIGIFWNLFPRDSLVVSFQVKDNTEQFCEQHQYHVTGDLAGEVWQTGDETKCFFDMYE